MHHSLGLAAFVALVTTLSVGCGHGAKSEGPELATRPSPSAGTGFDSTGGEMISEKLLSRPQRAVLEERISFGFDQFDLSPAAREILSTKAEILRSAPTLTLRIEGHADERGSDEYNLALSNRRAASATRFLVHHGIHASRLETVGYGEEQPLDPAENEAAWALNRRAEFRVSANRLAQQ